jgi:hypothetical protein
MRMAADWHCIFRKAEVGIGGWVKPSQHAVGESIISAFGIICQRVLIDLFKESCPKRIDHSECAANHAP